MKRILLIAISLMLILPGYAQRKKSAISIGPATLNFNLAPGQTSTQTVYIHNKLNKPYSFTLELGDWSLDTAGNDVFYEAGTYPNSCAQWITIDKKALEVPANSKEGINVTLTVPDSANVMETKWTMLNIMTTSERKAPKAAGALEIAVAKSLAVGVRIYQNPNSPEIVKEIRMLDFIELPDSNIYRIESRNTGAALLRCHYSIELSGETGERITVGPVEALVLPGQDRNVDIKLPDTLPKGRYTAIALIEAGDDTIPLEAAQKEIEIK